MGHTIIVGASAAGLAAADGLREGGFTGRITVLGEETCTPYDRPVLSKSLLADSGGAAPAPLRTEAHLAEKGIDLQRGHAAVGLDIDRRMVVTDYGEALAYEHVVIATGCTARPVHTTAGTPLPTLRNLDDLGTIRALVETGRPMTLIGGGFIGLEIATALRTRGIGVTVLGTDRLPLLRFVGEEVAAWLAGVHRSHGVDLHLGARTAAVVEKGDGFEIALQDGGLLHAEIVLAGAGAAPRVDWLVGSGVALGDGVLCDAAGRTSVPGVWAAGDVACAVDPRTGERSRFEHWTHAVAQGHHVGLAIARGEATPFDAVPYLWTEQQGRTLHLLGRRRPGDRDVLVEGEIAAGEFVVLHGSGDDLHGVTVCGRIRALRAYRRLLGTGASLSEAIGLTSAAS